MGNLKWFVDRIDAEPSQVTISHIIPMRPWETPPDSEAAEVLPVLLEYEAGGFGQSEDYLNRFVEAMELVPVETSDYGFSTLVLYLADRITGYGK